MIKLSNGFYFMYIAIAVFLTLALLLLLVNKSRKTIHTVLTVLLFINLALHFIKQAFPPYRDFFPTSLRSSALQNLCAVSTVLFPFIYLIKKQNVLHDYAYFIGMCGGIGGVLYPIEAIGQAPFALDTLRFYFCHITLFMVPLVAAILGIYRPRLKYFWTIPLLFLVWQVIICLDEFFLIGVGLVDAPISKLLDAGFRNSSFTFGVRPDFAWAKKVFDPIVPKFLRTDAFNINGGKPFYFPVLWLIFPSIVFLTPLYIILSFPFWLRKNSRSSSQE